MNAGAQRTIVIADDEAPIRLVVGDKLRSSGLVVHAASNGDDALALVRQHLPDAVITDLQMPGMNGLELCSAMKADPRTAHIPALLLTARGHVLDEQMLARTNIRKIMGKPFSARELVAFVQEHLLKVGEPKAGETGQLAVTRGAA